jgi:hypothetical protein
MFGLGLPEILFLVVGFTLICIIGAVYRVTSFAIGKPAMFQCKI